MMNSVVQVYKVNSFQVLVSHSGEFKHKEIVVLLKALSSFGSEENL